ncbi:DUF1611 domain-containing protein [Terrabacter carboxydivorans]|uniref:DUF1611 domain-containing protein n=1 Tax=Terrabacter carboxydivorans TaxID=619730 RepID=A0ABP5ZUK1_9MICO
MIPVAKWSYVTRPVTSVLTADFDARPWTADPTLGDLVLARVENVGVHGHLEDVHGRRVVLYPGDLVVGALGNRYATDFFEGYLPAGPRTHLLTAGGVIGDVASAHVRRDAPTELEIIASVTRQGRALRLDDFARDVVPAPAAPGGVVVVVGSSMNAGKTTTASAIVRGWTRAGIRAGAGKVTGSGSGKDRWTYQDAGAHALLDFLDFGMPSTFGYPMERLRATAFAIRDGLVADGAEAVVLEIADGLLQEETRGLLEALPDLGEAIVLAVGDALGAVAGVRVLADAGLRPVAISGLVSASPLASREAEAATGLPVLGVSELSGGSLLPLLAGRGALAEPVSSLRA